MAEHLATVLLTTGEDGVEAKVDTELAEGELAEILHIVADEMAGQERPRAAGSWGYRPE